jgi:hypothetical protein
VPAETSKVWIHGNTAVGQVLGEPKSPVNGWTRVFGISHYQETPLPKKKEKLKEKGENVIIKQKKDERGQTEVNYGK